jgi:hypothetical protein
MKNIVLKFGLIAGGFLAAMMAITIPFSDCYGGVLTANVSMLFGYTTMVLAFMLVFIGIKSYRDKAGAGTISFWKAFQVGIFITLIASAIYVLAWEILSHTIFTDFADKYAASAISTMRSSGASDAAIAAKQQEMLEFKRMYANPFFHVAMTFIEVFPVGLVMTLIASGILRKPNGGQPPSAVPETA